MTSAEDVGRALDGVAVALDDVEIDAAGARVAVRVSQTDATPRGRVRAAVRHAIGALPGVDEVVVSLAAQSPAARGGPAPAVELPGVREVLCVMSGKGGVGKSTLTANLAVALARDGHRVGVLDADIYGYSIPRMLGVDGEPDQQPDGRIRPLRSPDGVAVMSIGFFLPARGRAVVWRGPMLHKALRQFVGDVDWGELDFLLVDLAPGTGDVAMTIAGMLPQARVVLVTTPQPAAQTVAARAADLAAQFGLEVAGVIENMAALELPGGGPPLAIFGEGGGAELAADLDVPLVASVPLDPALRVGADAGRPLLAVGSRRPAAEAIRVAARALAARGAVHQAEAR